MFINKTGSEHIEYGINNQDYGFENDRYKVVVDGCSSGQHSEVGAKLFCKIFEEATEKAEVALNLDFITYLIDSIFAVIIKTTGSSNKDLRDYLSFTIFIAQKNGEKTDIFYCGDGYFFTLEERVIDYTCIDNGEYPFYYMYNFISNKKAYKDLITIEDIKIRHINIDTDFKDVGVATDGLRYVLRNKNIKPKFETLLINRETFKMKRFLNINKEKLKDDITFIL